MKSDEDLVNHLLTWGFLQAVCVCLKNALDTDRRGEPVTCVVRLLHQFVGTYLQDNSSLLSLRLSLTSSFVSLILLPSI